MFFRNVLFEEGVYDLMLAPLGAQYFAAFFFAPRKTCYFARIQKAQANFLEKTLPALVSKSRRKDGLPHLLKIYEALKVKYSLRLLVLAKKQ